jgi:acyl-CoA synthetase (AMP-forming)/AMP-acid ligase II
MISGGENVNLKEIEEILSTHPDIKECTVVAVPDKYWGKAVSTAVTLRKGTRLTRDGLRDWARDKLANHKLPQKILVQDSLPRTAVGKVMKPEIVKLFLEKDNVTQN